MPDCEYSAAHRDPEERRTAVARLEQSAASLPQFLNAIGDTDWRVRKTAVEKLAGISGPDVINGLMQALSADHNAGARNAAIEALIRKGPEAVEDLLSALASPDPDVRKFLVDILGEIRDFRASSRIMQLLTDADENIRVAAAEALGKIGDPAAVDALLACFDSPDSGWLPYAAAEALGEIGDDRALNPLLGVLAKNQLREPIHEALGKIGNINTLSPLVVGLSDPLRIVREASVAALDAIYRKSGSADRQLFVAHVRNSVSDRAVFFLHETLRTGSGDLRKSAILTLGCAGKKPSIPALLAVLQTGELEDSVARALVMMGRELAPEMLPFLSDGNSLVRKCIAKVMGVFRVAEAETALMPLLHDENGHVRSAAAESLGALKSSVSIDPLLSLLRDDYESVRESAIKALAEIGDESVLSGLVVNFSHQPVLRRVTITRLLSAFSGNFASESLAFALKDEEREVRKAAVRGLANLGGEVPLRSLMLAVTDDDPEVRMIAAEGLGGFQKTCIPEVLISLLEDDDLWVRAAAARSLGRVGGVETAELLASYLSRARDIFLLALIDVLGKLRSSAVFELLSDLVSHEDPEVRKSVLAALAHYSFPDIRETILSRLTDSHWSVRKAAVDILKRHRDSSIDALLLDMSLNDPDAYVRQAAGNAGER